MDRAVENQEFSLMLAGFLVASSAAAVVGVYFLMSDYFMFVNQANGAFNSYDAVMIEGELPGWFDSMDASAFQPADLPKRG